MTTRRRQIYFIRVGSSCQLLTEIFVINNEDNPHQTWFEDRHLQEVIILLRDSIQVKLSAFSEESKQPRKQKWASESRKHCTITSGESTVMTGQSVKIGYKFVDTFLRYHTCLLPNEIGAPVWQENDVHAGGGFNSVKLFPKKLVVFVCEYHPATVVQTTSTLMRSLCATPPSKNLAISSYFAPRTDDDFMMDDTGSPQQKRTKLQKIVKGMENLKDGKISGKNSSEGVFPDVDTTTSSNPEFQRQHVKVSSASSQLRASQETDKSGVLSSKTGGKRYKKKHMSQPGDKSKHVPGTGNTESSHPKLSHLPSLERFKYKWPISSSVAPDRMEVDSTDDRNSCTASASKVTKSPIKIRHEKHTSNRKVITVLSPSSKQSACIDTQDSSSSVKDDISESSLQSKDDICESLSEITASPTFPCAKTSVCGSSQNKAKTKVTGRSRNHGDDAKISSSMPLQGLPPSPDDDFDVRRKHVSRVRSKLSLKRGQVTKSKETDMGLVSKTHSSNNNSNIKDKIGEESKNEIDVSVDRKTLVSSKNTSPGSSSSNGDASETDPKITHYKNCHVARQDVKNHQLKSSELSDRYLSSSSKSCSVESQTLQGRETSQSDERGVDVSAVGKRLGTSTSSDEDLISVSFLYKRPQGASSVVHDGNTNVDHCVDENSTFKSGSQKISQIEDESTDDVKSSVKGVVQRSLMGQQDVQNSSQRASQVNWGCSDNFKTVAKQGTLGSSHVARHTKRTENEMTKKGGIKRPTGARKQTDKFKKQNQLKQLIDDWDDDEEMKTKIPGTDKSKTVQSRQTVDSICSKLKLGKLGEKDKSVVKTASAEVNCHENIHRTKRKNEFTEDHLSSEQNGPISPVRKSQKLSHEYTGVVDTSISGKSTGWREENGNKCNKDVGIKANQRIGGCSEAEDYEERGKEMKDNQDEEMKDSQDNEIIDLSHCEESDDDLFDDILGNLRYVKEMKDSDIAFLTRKNKKYFSNIFQGKKKCERHNCYKRKGAQRMQLGSSVRLGPFREEHMDVIMSELVKTYCTKHFKYMDYISKVLLPEALTKIFMDFHGVNHAVAEEVMMGLKEEEPRKSN